MSEAIVARPGRVLAAVPPDVREVYDLPKADVFV